MVSGRVIIVGAGPAGLFAALSLAAAGRFEVVVLDQGRDVDERLAEGGLRRERMTQGVGGAGLWTSGLLNLVPAIGGLADFVERDKAQGLIDEIDAAFVAYGAPDTIFDPPPEFTAAIKHRAFVENIEFVAARQRLIGTDRSAEVIRNFKAELEGRGVRFRLGTRVEGVERDRVCLENEELAYDHLILAPGRAGMSWLEATARHLGMEMTYEPIDLGVRVEVPADIMGEICSVQRDPKFIIRTRTHDSQARTFCTNHRGYVTTERYDSYVATNGHSYQERQSSNSNFALLVRVSLNFPQANTTEYGRGIARLCTILSDGGTIVQRLTDLRRHRRSTPERLSTSLIAPTLGGCAPGDLRMAYPDRLMTDILDALEQLDAVIPGVYTGPVLLHGPEIKESARRFSSGGGMRTSIENILVAGDAAGTRGIVAAAATGLVAAEQVIKNN